MASGAGRSCCSASAVVQIVSVVDPFVRLNRPSPARERLIIRASAFRPSDIFLLSRTPRIFVVRNVSSSGRISRLGGQPWVMAGTVWSNHRRVSRSRATFSALRRFPAPPALP